MKSVTIKRLKSKAMISLTFRLPLSDAQLVRRIARKKKCTSSDLLRSAWQEFAEKYSLTEV